MTPRPHGLAELRRVAGDIRIDSGRVIAPPHWESRNLVRLDFLGHSIRVHRLLLEPLQAAEKAFLATSCPWRPTTIGVFAPRSKRGGGTELSVHSWAMALDVDAATNPMILHCPAGDPRRYVPTHPTEFTSSMKAAGFVHGADFAHSYDPQHYQFVDGY